MRLQTVQVQLVLLKKCKIYYKRMQNCKPTHMKYVNCKANIAMPSLSQDPATERDIYPGAIIQMKKIQKYTIVNVPVP